MMLTCYEPYYLIDRFHDGINRLFNTSPGNSAVRLTRWTPAVDILEDELRYMLRAVVPGVGRHDIDITLEDTVLTIKGAHKPEHADSKQGYRRRERLHGHFLRQFTLPDSVETAGISARLNDGVLEIGIPKQAKPAPRKIILD